jgi:mannan endo-1,4-beta-mannosidase
LSKDVTAVPTNGTWFQLISNGTTLINNGTNGLQRLDKVVELAERHGIYLMLSLTNNWNPLPGIDGNKTNTTTTVPNVARRDVTPGTNNTLNRNFLSNDYGQCDYASFCALYVSLIIAGGMDAYVREFGVTKQHEEFYMNDTIIEIFKNYTTNIVSRYVNSPAVFAWELANDARFVVSKPSPDILLTQCPIGATPPYHRRIA